MFGCSGEEVQDWNKSVTSKLSPTREGARYLECDFFYIMSDFSLQLHLAIF